MFLRTSKLQSSCGHYGSSFVRRLACLRDCLRGLAAFVASSMTERLVAPSMEQRLQPPRRRLTYEQALARVRFIRTRALSLLRYLEDEGNDVSGLWFVVGPLWQLYRDTQQLESMILAVLPCREISALAVSAMHDENFMHKEDLEVGFSYIAYTLADQWHYLRGLVPHAFLPF